ncbi:MAG: thrombospondin type 3 repeat-containing protein, partial [Myxococcota bacterium]|nr:thrombospondin type 3 repeat-containing protein [Myxococcota bacterium]
AFSFVPVVHDADGDGIEDARDECDHLPEDFDGHEDTDGCLDPDNDGDVVPDVDDACPSVPAEQFRDEDEDGCTDPVVDADGDGAADGADACPNQPEDADGHQDEDGCPDADNDADGVPDGSDGCPREAEDADGHQDEDGCPDADDDADGVPDATDRCPGEPERINGIDDDDGCPDRGGRPAWRERGPDAVTGVLRFGADGRLAVGSRSAVDQLVLHVRRLGGQVDVTLPPGSPPGAVAGLAEALRTRGLDPAGLAISIADPSTSGPSGVLVRRRSTATTPSETPR